MPYIPVNPFRKTLSSASVSSTLPTSRRRHDRRSNALISTATPSLAALRSYTAEHLIVVDLSGGFIRTTVPEARMYANMGYRVLDLAGYGISFASDDRSGYHVLLRGESSDQAMGEVTRSDAFAGQFAEVFDVENMRDGEEVRRRSRASSVLSAEVEVKGPDEEQGEIWPRVFQIDWEGRLRCLN